VVGGAPCLLENAPGNGESLVREGCSGAPQRLERRGSNFPSTDGHPIAARQPATAPARALEPARRWAVDREPHDLVSAEFLLR
jgi:hypothetical protein